MSGLDWDSKTVIGSKGKTAKVTRTTSDLNGTHPAPMKRGLTTG